MGFLTRLLGREKTADDQGAQPNAFYLIPFTRETAPAFAAISQAPLLTPNLCAPLLANPDIRLKPVCARGSDRPAITTLSDGSIAQAWYTGDSPLDPAGGVTLLLRQHQGNLYPHTLWVDEAADATTTGFALLYGMTCCSTSNDPSFNAVMITKLRGDWRQAQIIPSRTGARVQIDTAEGKRPAGKLIQPENVVITPTGFMTHLWQHLRADMNHACGTNQLPTAAQAALKLG